MPALTYSYSPSDLVLVTGANGHVAQHFVDQLLAIPGGPRVRGTVRLEASAKQISAFYAVRGIQSKRLEFVVVPDMIKEGAFDEAVKDVTHIAHIASPVIINPKDVKNDLLNPAIQGTVGILKSALNSSRIKSVVITSSLASVFDLKQGWRPGYTYTADDWNPLTFEDGASPDLDLTAYPDIFRPFVTYFVSKVVAERAAWDFHRRHSPRFTLSTILPTLIGGPNVLPLSKGLGAASLSFSQRLIWRTGTEKKLTDMDWPAWVDVRDVAKAHVNALINPEAAGKRWMVSAHLVTYSDIANIIRRRIPSLSPSTEVQHVDHYNVDGSPALSVLGIGTYIPMEDTVIDTIRQALL